MNITRIHKEEKKKYELRTEVDRGGDCRRVTYCYYCKCVIYR